MRDLEGLQPGAMVVDGMGKRGVCYNVDGERDNPRFHVLREDGMVRAYDKKGRLFSRKGMGHALAKWALKKIIEKAVAKIPDDFTIPEFLQREWEGSPASAEEAEKEVSRRAEREEKAKQLQAAAEAESQREREDALKSSQNEQEGAETRSDSK